MYVRDKVGCAVFSVPHKQGSVIMEFLLVLPIRLLLFVATMLWMDISLGKMYIQEANRNLAWLTADRYDDGKIKASLYDSVREPYELRNKVEKSFGGTGDMWKYAGGTTDVWGHVESSFPAGMSQYLRTSQECDWHAMTTGNMNLKMAHLSGVYMGAVALGSILQPDGETNHLYASVYDFTRSRMASGSNDVVALSFNPEAVVIHRAYDNDNPAVKSSRINVTTPNNLLPVLLQSWPTDGTSLQEFVGGLGGVASEDSNVDMGDGGSDNDPARDLFLGINRPAITTPSVAEKFLDEE